MRIAVATDLMFLRCVTVKGHEYLLLVESHRQGTGPRQRVLRYFGRRDRVDMEQVLAYVEALRNGFGAPGRAG